MGNESLSEIMGYNHAAKLSRTPSKPYHSASSQHIRIDSVQSTYYVPSACWPYTHNQACTSETNVMPPTPEELYVSMLVAATDKSKTYTIVEALLHEIDPLMNIDEFLTLTGDPTWRFEEYEEDGLRSKLRGLLYPSYESRFPSFKQPTLDELIQQVHPGTLVNWPVDSPIAMSFAVS